MLRKRWLWRQKVEVLLILDLDGAELVVLLFLVLLVHLF